jgi:hypothetical protein
MTIGEPKEYFNPYERIPHIIEHEKPMPVLVPSVTPAEAAKAKCKTMCLVALKLWEMATVFTLIIVGPVLIVIAPIAIHAFFPLIGPHVLLAAIAIVFIAVTTFIIWKFVCNTRMKSDYPEPPIPYNPIPKYALKVSAETATRIAKLELPNLGSLSNEAREVCAHLGVWDTASMRKRISSALKKPYFQSGPNCFAASHLIRWQVDNPLLVVQILHEFFTTGKFDYQDATGKRAIMHPVLEKGNSSALEVIADSLGALFEAPASLAAGSSQTGLWLLNKLAEIGKKAADDPAIKPIFDKYYNAQTTARSDVKSLQDIFARQCRDPMAYDSQGYFRLHTPINALFKSCGMPSPLRKYFIRQLGADPLCTLVGNDVLFSGHAPPPCTRIFSRGACNSLCSGNDPRECLEKVLQLKESLKLSPGKLIPADVEFVDTQGNVQRHSTNVIIPNIKSLDEIKDGQFIPLVWTGWRLPCQWGVTRRGERFEWTDEMGRHVNVTKLSIRDPDQNMFMSLNELPNP